MLIFGAVSNVALLCLVVLAPGCVGMNTSSQHGNADPNVDLANRIRAAVVKYREERGKDAPAFLEGFEKERYWPIVDDDGESFALGRWFFEPGGLLGPCMTKGAGAMRTFVIRLDIKGDKVVVTHAGVVRAEP